MICSSFLFEQKKCLQCLPTSIMTPDNNAVYSRSSLCRPAETVPEGGTPAAPDSLWRRYSEFELLRTYLLVAYPYIIIPPLPEKRVSDAYCRWKDTSNFSQFLTGSGTCSGKNFHLNSTADKGIFALYKMNVDSEKSVSDRSTLGFCCSVNKTLNCSELWSSLCVILKTVL